MSKFIYRVLNEDEICDKGLGQGIYGETFSIEKYNTNTLSDALNDITTYIVKGELGKTNIISCSNDLCSYLKKYAKEQFDLRPYLAIISNHSNSIVECENFNICKEKIILLEEMYTKIKAGLTFEEYLDFVKQDKLLSAIYKDLHEKTDPNSKAIIKDKTKYVLYPRTVLAHQINLIKQANIKKIVINTSRNINNDEVCKFFFERESIFNKNALQKEKINKSKYGTGNNSEVIVLNHISQKDIKVLNPLQYDILYCLCYNFTIPYHDIKEEIINQIDIFKEENYQVFLTTLDEEEKNIFKQMYIERKTIYSLVETLTDFSKVIEIKKRIIKKCIEILNTKFNKNYTIKYIFTIEQSIELDKSSYVKIEDDKILRKTL